MASMRTIGVRLRMETGQYKADAAQATAATTGLKKAIADTGNSSKLDMDKISRGMALVGGALLGVAGAAVMTAAKFDKQMSEVGAVANATAGEMDQLRKAAIDAGQATVFSATEAAQAEAELAKAGLTTSDILGGALAGALSLASAGTLDLATAAEISANAMNTFGLEGKDVEHIADVLAAAANKSAAGVSDLGQGLQQVGLIANQVGFSLEETVGLLAAFADRGLKGSDGATSLKTALMRLASPTDKAANLMEELGISMYDANGNMIGAVDIAGQLQGALKDLTPAQRNAALQTMFGSDAIRAANILYTEGAAGIADYINSVNDQGAASEVAAKKLDNLAGDVEQLTGSLETLAVGGGSGASGGLRTLTQGATDLVNAFGQLPSAVQSGAVIFAGVGGAALLATVGVLKLKAVLGTVAVELAKTGPAGEKFASGMQSTVKWAGRAAAALTALEIVSQVAAALRDASIDTQSLADSMENLAKSGDVSTEILDLLGEDLHGFGEAVRATQGWGADLLKGTEAIPVIGDIFAEGERMASDFNRSAGDSAEVLKAIDDQLATMVREGNTEQAIAIVQKLAAANNLMFDEMEAALPGFTQAYMDAANAARQTGDAATGAVGPTKELAGAMNDAAMEADALTTEWQELNGATLSADESMLAAKKAVDDVAASFAKNGKAIKGNSEAALENRIALAKAGEAATGAAQDYYDLTGDIDGAMKILKDQRKAAEDAAVANGGNATQVHELGDELFRLPKATSTAVKVQGAAAGEAAVRSLRDAIAGLRSKTVFVTSIVSSIVSGAKAGANRWGGITEHAADGLLKTAAVYAPAAPARYAFAEPQTGGEAFVPKRGNYGRSMQILSAAAGWYNADVVPRNGWYGSGGGGAAGGQVQVVLPPGGTPFERALVEVLRGLSWTVGGGSAQKSYGRAR